MEKQRRKEQQNNIVSFIPNGDYYFKKALKAIEHDQMDKAYKYMKRAAELSPDDAHVLMQFGILEMDAENFESAYECIHTAYSLEPSEPEYVFFLAEVSGCIGMVHDAKKYAEMYLQMEPDGIYAMEASEILEFVEQEEDLEIFDEEDSEKFIAQEKARRFMENGQFTQAIEILEHLIETFPDLWPAYNNLALAYFYIGEVEQARALLKQVLRENHGNLHAICNLAVIAYYEKSNDELSALVNILKKINPFDWENRYKLGATLSLIGEHELAFKWLRSMSKRGYEGDNGFYFWLAQSAYFSGHEQIAEAAWKTLVELDPSKKGLEPWLHIEQKVVEVDSLEQNRDAIVEKITSKYSAHRMFGFFLLSKSAHKQEIVAHPSWIDLSKYNGLEKLSLAYALNHKFNENNMLEKRFMRAMKVAEQLYEKSGSVTLEVQYLFQMWFVLSERALEHSYEFKNVKALAAAVEFMFYSTINSNRVTKKEYAQKYNISVATLTKYVEDLIEYLPFE
nr:tetratricopeptide repeat protein [Lysinibacillus timonensis]